MMTGSPASVPLTPALPIDWPTDWPNVRLYPIEDHIADKICGMYEWPGDTPSSRYRDLADLLLLAQREDLNGAFDCIRVQ
jgi:Nucleotidyl transferase AbiEii toxin, Type IV TA system